MEVPHLCMTPKEWQWETTSTIVLTSAAASFSLHQNAVLDEYHILASVPMSQDSNWILPVAIGNATENVYERCLKVQNQKNHRAGKLLRCLPHTIFVLLRP